MFSRFLNETRVKAPDGFEVELENGKKFQIVKGDKLVLTNGEEIKIDSEVVLMHQLWQMTVVLPQKQRIKQLHIKQQLHLQIHTL